MNIETRKKGDVVIVDFQGRLAVGVGDEVLPRLVTTLLDEGNRKILLNLSEMEYIDSNGLGELVQSLKTSKRFGASLRLLKPQDRVQKTLRLTNLLPMFSVYDSEGEAMLVHVIMPKAEEVAAPAEAVAAAATATPAEPEVIKKGKKEEAEEEKKEDKKK